MKDSFKKAFRIFKYISIFFIVIFWIYMIVDDFIFIEKYGISIEGVELWFMWFLLYYAGFTFYFWTISLAVILIYHKTIKRNK